MSLRIGDLTVLNVLIWKAFVQSYIEKTVSSLIFAHQCSKVSEPPRVCVACTTPSELMLKASLCAAEQFHSDASLDAVDRKAPNNSKNWQWIAKEDDAHINLGDHDGRIRVRRYAGERCLPDCVIERHSGLTPGVMVWGAILYHGRSNFLRIEAGECTPTCCKDCSRLLFCPTHKLLLWFAYSPDMSPIEHSWDLVGRRLARDPRPEIFKRRNFAAHTSNMEFSSRSRHSKSV
ncbi:transposable element Tc1 transposase [Trichonephila clavipes]|nr:transposable element Tc1 transposase [Trichonephila clavipes]